MNSANHSWLRTAPHVSVSANSADIHTEVAEPTRRRGRSECGGRDTNCSASAPCSLRPNRRNEPGSGGRGVTSVAQSDGRRCRAERRRGRRADSDAPGHHSARPGHLRQRPALGSLTQHWTTSRPILDGWRLRYRGRHRTARHRTARHRAARHNTERRGGAARGGMKMDGVGPGRWRRREGSAGGGDSSSNSRRRSRCYLPASWDSV